MNTYKNFIGIDVSKDSLDIFVLPDSTSSKISNNKRSINTFIKKMKTLQHPFVTLEASGGYERAVVDALLLHRIPVAVENPCKIRHFAKALGILAKTDKIDAKVIASFAQMISPRPKAQSDESTKQLKELNARRQQLVVMLTAEKNRLQQADPLIQRDILAHIQYLERQLSKIEEKIKKIIQSDEKMKQKEKILRTVKGVGPVTSAVMLSDLEELGQVSNRKITALVGLAPFPKDTGKSTKKRFICGGRSAVRHILYMAALTAAHRNPVIQPFYKKLINAGKAQKVAIVACMRKLLVILNATMKKYTLSQSQLAH